MAAGKHSSAERSVLTMVARCGSFDRPSPLSAPRNAFDFFLKFLSDFRALRQRRFSSKSYAEERSILYTHLHKPSV